MLHNVPTKYNGTLFPSKTEAKRAQDLDKEKAEGKNKWWVGQITLPVVDKLGKHRKVIVDFLVMREHLIFEETKNGLITEEFIEKSFLILEQYPGLPYDVLEPTATGWKRTPLAEFIKPYLQVQAAPTKQYTKTQIFLSKCFYKLVSKIV